MHSLHPTEAGEPECSALQSSASSLRSSSSVLVLYLIDIIPMDGTDQADHSRDRHHRSGRRVAAAIVWVHRIGSQPLRPRPSCSRTSRESGSIGPGALLRAKRYWLPPHVAPPHQAVLAAEDAREGLRVGDVLLVQDARGETLGGVLVEHRNHALQDDCAVVDGLIHEVNGASGHLGAELERLGLHIESGKRGQKRWMDVQDAVGERRAQTPARRCACIRPGRPGPRDAARSAAIISASCSARLRPAEGMAMAGRPSLRAASRPAASGRFESTTAISVPRQTAFADRLGDGDKVRTASREQNPESLQAVPPPSTSLASGARPPLCIVLHSESVIGGCEGREQRIFFFCRCGFCWGEIWSTERGLNPRILILQVSIH
jgi:hypothetical protein